MYAQFPGAEPDRIVIFMHARVVIDQIGVHRSALGETINMLSAPKPILQREPEQPTHSTAPGYSASFSRQRSNFHCRTEFLTRKFQCMWKQNFEPRPWVHFSFWVPLKNIVALCGDFL